MVVFATADHREATSSHDQREPDAELGLLDVATVGTAAAVGGGRLPFRRLAAGIAGPAAILAVRLNGVAAVSSGAFARGVGVFGSETRRPHVRPRELRRLRLVRRDG